MIRLDRLVLGVIVAATLSISACSAGSDAPRTLRDWDQVTLPDGMVPSTLLVGKDMLLVGGHRPAGADRSPAMVKLPIDGTDVGPAPVPLTATTPYGKIADLVSLTRSGERVVAMGAAHGGAHANFRWTIWTGTTDRLVDRPQTFETFGGWEAGTLLGVATDSRGPMVVGTWQGSHGQDGAIWRAEGERWVRQPPVPALANTAEQQVGPRNVDQQPAASVAVSGSVIDLRGGVRQSAAYWRDVSGSWSLTTLPDPGKRSEAWSTACAEVCWSVGARDGAVAVWSDRARSAVPAVRVEDADTGRILLWRDRVVAVIDSDAGGRLLVGQDDRWRIYTAPDGPIRSAALRGARLYLVAGAGDSARLVSRDLTDVLGG